MTFDSCFFAIYLEFAHAKCSINTPMVTALLKTSSVVRWRLLWFLVHLAAIYALANFLTPELAAWANQTLFPLLHMPPSTGGLVFLYAHLFAFSFFPALVLGFSAGEFKGGLAHPFC